MLALYTEESEVPSTLLDAPSVVSEKALMPLTLMPLPPDDQVKMLLCGFLQQGYNMPYENSVF